MEFWFLVVLTLCVAALIKSTLDLFFSKPKFKQRQQKLPLPPGPFALPLLGNLLLLRRSVSDIERALRSLHAKYGPIVSLRFGSSSRRFIFVASRSLAHAALVLHGASFSDRPRPAPTAVAVGSNQHNINSAPYGPNWRLLRRNLTSRLLHPSRGLPSFSSLRRRVLRRLLQSLSDSESPIITPLDDFRYTMFCLLVFMCFGADDQVDDKKIRQIMEVQIRMIRSVGRFRILNFWPRLGKILFRNRWKELFELFDGRATALLPLIRNRIRVSETKLRLPKSESQSFECYADTLFDLELPEEGKRKLREGELVSLCSEFLTAGTDTTTTALQWIMANLVKYPKIQEKLFAEIGGVLSLREGRERKEEPVTVEEEDLQKMPYLKAVILEALRRHPPGHFVVPHGMTVEVELGGYVIPKNATVNFMVAEMGLDPEVWEDPLAFKPERFIGGGGEVGFDITGSREIKMMPFGVGRRICPGLGLALLHLEYFVANLVWRFEWRAVEGDEVDLSEKEEFTVAMKNPLRVHLFPRPMGNLC